MRSIVIHGVVGIVVAVLLGSAGCSSSDGPGSSADGGVSGKGVGGASGKGGGASSSAGKGGSVGSKGGAGGASSAGKGGMASGASSGKGAQAGEGGEAGESQGGSAGAGVEDPCAACASGLCLPNGQCLECLPNNDQCPAGKYCSADNTCVAGCKDAASCASGVCGANHDCQSCISDQECAAEHVCGAQQCATACTAQQEGGNPGCGTGLTCCSLHCVDVANDSRHCGACGTACTAAQFCGLAGCVSSKVSSVCEVPKVVVVLDGQVGDDPVGRAVGQMLVARCPTAPTVREVAQTVADAVNPANGRPVVGGDELIVIAGGNAVQSAAGYLTANSVAPLSNALKDGKFQIIETSTGALISSEQTGDANDSHDLFAVQFIREATSGSLILNTYGFDTSGTRAASVYLDQALLTNLTGATKSWYVGEWTDANADKIPDFSELVLIDSGG